MSGVGLKVAKVFITSSDVFADWIFAGSFKSDCGRSVILAHINA